MWPARSSPTMRSRLKRSNLVKRDRHVTAATDSASCEAGIGGVAGRLVGSSTIKKQNNGKASRRTSWGQRAAWRHHDIMAHSKSMASWQEPTSNAAPPTLLFEGNSRHFAHPMATKMLGASPLPTIRRSVLPTKPRVTWPYATVTSPHLEEVHHLGVKLRALRQRVEDEVMDASNAVAVEEVSASGVEEQVAVPPEKPRSRSCHLEPHNTTRTRTRTARQCFGHMITVANLCRQNSNTCLPVSMILVYA